MGKFFKTSKLKNIHKVVKMTFGGPTTEYALYLKGKKFPIGKMTVDARTKEVVDSGILKEYRKKGWGTKLYEGALRQEGALQPSTEKYSDAAAAVWNKLRRKYPPILGGRGISHG